jgi:ABC-type bacteriocin/lantibiotic exporter with double-glycine peptidase domain
MKWIILLFILAFSVYADPPDWYVDQSGGRGNCGPACVAMAINWSKDEKISASTVRDIIGYKYNDGRTSWNELKYVLDKYGIYYYSYRAPTLEKLISLVINSRQLVIILLDPTKLSPAEGFTGRNYTYRSSANHYIILESYRSEYFLVQDPMPENYNRLYKSTEVWKSMTKDIIVIYD